MPFDQRKKDVNWKPADEDGNTPTWERANLAVMMDIRDELKDLNRILHCQNFLDIPQKLEAIRRNTDKPRKKKA